jgi:hypothetical protein
MDKTFKFGLPDSVIDSVRQIMEAKKMKGICPHCGKNPCECDHDHDKKDMKEELKGDQKKIDANHNGKIDAEDFKLLKQKKMKEEVEEIDEAEKADKQWVRSVSPTGSVTHTAVHPSRAYALLNQMKARGHKATIVSGKDSPVKEEVEEIDELSKDTLKSYIKKSTSGSAPNSALNLAAHAAHKMTRRKGSDVDDAIKLRDKAEKRGEGVVKAANKMAKEEIEFSAEEMARIEEIAKKND